MENCSDMLMTYSLLQKKNINELESYVKSLNLKRRNIKCTYEYEKNGHNKFFRYNSD